MEYEAQLAPVDKMIVTPHGVFEPLCNKCISPDCTNPIEERLVSLAGRLVKNRVWIEHSGSIRQVVECKGYVGDATPSVDN